MKIYFWLVGAILLSSSCKWDKTTTNADNVLDIRMVKEPEKLNPVFFPNAVSREVQQYVFLPLGEYDPISMQLVPVMIKSLPIAVDITEGPYKGGTKFVFEILDEAKWDDGKPVTGDDYLFTLKAILHPGTSASAYRSIVHNFSDVIIDDANRKKITVIYNKYYMLAMEAVLNIEVLPKHIYDPAGILDKYNFNALKDEKGAEILVSKDSLLMQFANDCNGIKYTKEVVVGSGPYKLAKWNANQQIILEKKTNYWAVNQKSIATQQHADKIILHFIPDETAAITRLKNGELDVMSGINTATFDELKKSKDQSFQFKTAQLMKYYNVLINHNDNILKSKAVRKALAYVTNVSQYITSFENDNAIRTIGPIHPSKKFYNKEIKPYTFDIDASKKALAEDGWSDSNNDGTVDKKLNGKLTELILPLFVSGDLGNNIALMLQADAKKAGIGIEITKKEFAQIRKENIETGKYALCLQVSSPDIGYDDLNSKFHSQNAQLGDSNQGFYKNLQVDQLINDINTIKDDVQREKLYIQLQQVMNDDLPYIFLYSPKEKFVFSKNWQGSTNVKRPGYQANTFIAQ